MNLDSTTRQVLLLVRPSHPAHAALCGLDGRGFAVRDATDAADFLQRLGTAQADLAVVALDAVGPDAPSWIRRLRASTPAVALVAVPADPSGAACRVALLAEADGFLPADATTEEARAVLTAIAIRADRLRECDATIRDLRSRTRSERERAVGHFRRTRELIHEIGASLAILGGYGSNLLDGIDGPVTDAQRKSLERMKSASDVLAGILDRAREEASRDAPPTDRPEEARVARRTRLDASALAVEVAGLVQRDCETRGIVLQVRTAPGVPWIWGDRVRLSQLLLALLSNALRHTPRGGRIVVDVSAEPVETGDQVGAYRAACRLTVRDTGPGIPDEHREDCFLPGWTRSGEDGHSGLGLAVCRDVVREHGGTIRVADGPGAEFQVTLPFDPRARRGGVNRVAVVNDSVLAGHVLLDLRERTGERIEVRRVRNQEELAASSDGRTLILLDPAGDLDRVLDRIEGAGRDPAAQGNGSGAG